MTGILLCILGVTSAQSAEKTRRERRLLRAISGMAANGQCHTLSAESWLGVGFLRSGAGNGEFQKQVNGGDGGIRTLDTPLQAYNGLANRRLQPLGHVSTLLSQPREGEWLRGFWHGAPAPCRALGHVSTLLSQPREGEWLRDFHASWATWGVGVRGSWKDIARPQGRTKLICQHWRTREDSNS